MPQGGADACIQALDRFGRYKWSRLIGSPADDYAWAVATDDAGNVVIAGDTSDTSGAIGSPHGMQDCFAAKFGPTGQRLWLIQLGGPASDVCTSVATTPDGSVFVGGWTDGAIEPGAVNSGIRDAFVARLSGSTGAVLWIDQFGGGGPDSVEALSRAAGGDFFVAGVTTPCLGCVRDPLLRRYQTSGAVVWQAQPLFPEPFHEISATLYGVVQVGSDMVATVGALTPGDEGFGYPLVQMRDAGTGDVLWEERLGGDGYKDNLWSVAADTDEDIYVVGQTNEPMFDGALNAYDPYRSLPRNDDALLVSYTRDGVMRWGRQMGTSSDDSFNGVVLDDGNRIVLGGASNGAFATGSQGGYDLIGVKF